MRTKTTAAKTTATGTDVVELSVVVPARDEEARLGPTLDAVSYTHLTRATPA